MTQQELHVVFGTGAIGMAVMLELARRGKRVRMINRSGHADVPAGVEVVAANAYDPNSAREATRGADIVYQCAQPAYTEWPTQFPPLQAGIVEGTAANGARLVVCENLYMYGPVDGPLTEDRPYVACTRKGSTRAAMAQTLLDAHKSGQIKVVMGRGSDYFGPAGFASAVGDRVFRPALEGKKVYGIGDLDAPHTYTFTEDFGKGLVMLGEHEEAYGQAWHIPNAETQTSRQFLTTVFEEVGHPAKISAAPKLVLQAMSLFDPNVREMMELAYEFEQPYVVDHSKFVRAFGNIATPTRDAIQQTVEWFRQHPDAKGH